MRTICKSIAVSASLMLAFLFPSPAVAKLRRPRDYRAWTRVARCESGGWRVLGSAYPDALGITYVNYIDFGGKPLPPGPVKIRERYAMIRVADRLIRHYGAAIPDQYGCAAW